MNPVPTDAQWLVLYLIDDDDVVYVGDGKWRGRGPSGSFSITGAVQRLYQLGLVEIAADGSLKVTHEGVGVLKRRSVYEVLERRNRRRGEVS